MKVPRLLFLLKPYIKSFIIIVSPLIFLPLLIVSGTQEAKCGYVVLLMAVYWLSQAVPLAITALIPVMLFPLLGVMSTDEVCVQYLKETVMLALSGLIASTAIEYCNLHKKIALRVLLIVGTSPRLLMLGFMLTTMFLSMWISNTSSSAMMVPIVQSVLVEMKQNKLQLILGDKKYDRENKTTEEITLEQKQKIEKLEKQSYDDSLRYYLGIAYACNIGGTGTVIGTGTNLICLEMFNSVFPDGSGLNFTTWMTFNVPVMLINVLVAWIWLQILYMGLLTKGCTSTDNSNSKAVRAMIKQKYNELGTLTWHQLNVMILFIVLILLWFFREPEFIPGWASLYPNTSVLDSTPAVLIILLFFILPANLDFLTFDLKDRKTNPSLLNWQTVHNKVPWGVVLLLGGGYAMAEATQTSGLSAWLGEQLAVLENVPAVAIVAIICFVSSFLTEICSNTAIANILVPVLAELSKVVRVHPIYLMMPVTVCCSYSFMLPMATPTNAIVVEASQMKTRDMMKAGFGLNILTVTILMTMLNTYGYVIFDFGEFPSWAETSNQTAVLQLQ